MASNNMNKSKDINNTTISESSEEDPSQSFLPKFPQNHAAPGIRARNGYNEDNDPDIFIHITEGVEQKKKKNHSLVSEKTIYQLIPAIINDDKNSFEKIIKTINAPINEIINYITKEGMCLIHYAVIYGSISCFIYLLSQKVQTNKTCEGLPLIHLSLCKSIYIKNQEICLKMFNYIYDNLPEQRRYIDRLGRSFLHLIFEYDFMEALNDKKINMEDLFQMDKNGEYVINYVYIYNSGKCFWKVAKDPYFLGDLYREIRNKYVQNKKFMLKEKFLEKLFCHQNFYIIAII